VVDVGKMTSASHENYPCNLYAAQISIPPVLTFPAPRAMGANIATQGLVAIIGRDVLQGCVFIYNGGAGQITLCI